MRPLVRHWAPALVGGIVLSLAVVAQVLAHAADSGLTASGSAMLVVRTTVNRTAAEPGDTLTYAFSVQNSGPVDATGVAVSDNISGLLAKGRFLTATGGGSLRGSTVAWSNLTVRSGTTTTLAMSVRLNSGGWSPGTSTFTNTVVVPKSNCAQGSGGGDCRTTTTVQTSVNLFVRTEVDHAAAVPGDTVTFAIIVQNEGTADATGVTASDNISALLEHASFEGVSSGGSLSGGTLTWPGIAIGAGNSRTLAFSVRLASGGWPAGTTTLSNTVVVAGSNCGPGSTNASCRTTTPVTLLARVNVGVSVDSTRADPGQTLAYTITIMNNGNSLAGNLTLTSDIASLLSHGSLIFANGGGSLNGSVLRWTHLTIPRGASQSLQFSVKLGIGGWAVGTTLLTATAVVPDSDCPSGSPGANCRTSTSVTPRYSVTVSNRVGIGSSGPFSSKATVADGAVVWYRVGVSNSGTGTLTGLRVADNQGLPKSQCAPVPATLDPGASWTCTYFRHAARGTSIDKVTADTDQTASRSASTTVVASPPPAPAIRIEKSANPSSLPVGGGSVTFSYVVDNTGNVPLLAVRVSDDRCSSVTYRTGDTNGDGRLDPTETWRFTCGGRLTATTTGTGQVTGTYGSRTVTDTAGVTVVVLLAQPGLHLGMSASPSQLPAGGGLVSYTYVVTNVGNQDLSSISVTDDRCSPARYASGDVNGNNRLDLTETWRFGCRTNVDATTTSHATATGSAGGASASDQAQVAVTVAATAPAIHVVSSANQTTLPAGGGKVSYTYLVTNTGNIALAGVTLADDHCKAVQLVDGDADDNHRLDQSETWQYRCTAVVTAPTTSIATATGHAAGGTVTDTSSTRVAVTASNPAIGLASSADPASLPAGGGTVTFTFVLTNKGNVPLQDVGLADDICPAVRLTGGDSNADSRLDSNETWTYRCATTVANTSTSTAVATGNSAGQTVSDTDLALVTVGMPATRTPRIGLSLTASSADLPPTGGSITFTYVVANKGDVALTDVGLTDDGCSEMTGPSGDANADGLLDLVETWSYSCTVDLTVTTAETAAVTASYQGQQYSAIDMATVTVAASAPPPATDAPGDSGASAPSVSPAPTGDQSGPEGSVAGASSPVGASPNPDAAATIGIGTTPDATVMLLILLLGMAASGIILAISRRPPF